MNTKCDKHTKIQLIYYTFNLHDLYINTVQIHQYGPLLLNTKHFMFNIKHLRVGVSNLISIKFKCINKEKVWLKRQKISAGIVVEIRHILQMAIRATQLSLVVLVLRSVLQDASELNVIKHAVLDWRFPVHLIHLKHFTTFLSQQ
jgi:hypothetical protein